MKYYFQFIICKNWDSRILKKIRNPQNISILFSSPSFSVAIIANVVAGKKLAKMEDLGIERRSVERQTTIEYLVRQWWRGFSPSRIGTIWRGARRYPRGDRLRRKGSVVTVGTGRINQLHETLEERGGGVWRRAGRPGRR